MLSVEIIDCIYVYSVDLFTFMHFSLILSLIGYQWDSDVFVYLLMFTQGSALLLR